MNTQKQNDLSAAARLATAKVNSATLLWLQTQTQEVRDAYAEWDELSRQKYFDGEEFIDFEIAVALDKFMDLSGGGVPAEIGELHRLAAEAHRKAAEYAGEISNG